MKASSSIMLYIAGDISLKATYISMPARRAGLSAGKSTSKRNLEEWRSRGASTTSARGAAGVHSVFCRGEARMSSSAGVAPCSTMPGDDKSTSRRRYRENAAVKLPTCPVRPPRVNLSARLSSHEASGGDGERFPRATEIGPVEMPGAIKNTAVAWLARMITRDRRRRSCGLAPLPIEGRKARQSLINARAALSPEN